MEYALDKMEAERFRGEPGGALADFRMRRDSGQRSGGKCGAGCDYGTDLWNLCLQSCREASGQEEEGVLHLANSIWFLDDGKFQLKEDFLRTNAAYYGASLYGAPFDDTTRKDINRWVKRETDGMIEEIVREIPPLAVMYLVNALSFEAQWQDPYEDVSVDDGVFFGADGQEETVEMMRSEEYQYFADEDAR